MDTPNRIGSVGPINVTWVPVVADSLYMAVAITEADFAAMTASGFYLFTSTADCFIKQATAAPVAASAAAASMLVPRGLPVLIDAADGLYLSCIGLTTGYATLQRVKALR